MTCNGLVEETVAILRTAEMFLGVNRSLTVPKYMEEATLNFLSETLDYTMEERPI